MKLKDLQGTLRTIQYHSRLNPALWNGDRLDPEVRNHLLKIAEEFIKHLKLPDLKVQDILLTGSNAAFNWTPQRDIDLHVIADLSDSNLDCRDDLLDELIQAKKKTWNDAHEITIHGFDVELYLETPNRSHVTRGDYRVLHGKWVKKPVHEPPHASGREVLSKVKYWMSLIDSLSGCENPEALAKAKDKLQNFRKAGLQRGGEFSVENITYKILRNTGYFQKLIDCKNLAMDRELSLESSTHR